MVRITRFQQCASTLTHDESSCTWRYAEYKLSQQTLHMAVVLIDRFLARMPVKRSKLQLVGITCLLIASKMEEIHPPRLDEFVYGNACSPTDIPAHLSYRDFEILQ